MGQSLRPLRLLFGLGKAPSADPLWLVTPGDSSLPVTPPGTAEAEASCQTEYIFNKVMEIYAAHETLIYLPNNEYPWIKVSGELQPKSACV